MNDLATNDRDLGKAPGSYPDVEPALRHVVVIVGSAGCREPLQRIIDALPADMAAAVLVVLHYPPDFQSVLPRLLAKTARVPVKHAEPGEQLRPGQVYVAPTGRHHVRFTKDHLSIEPGPPIHRHTPAADPSLLSAAETYGPRAVGVVLSGADANGAEGLAALKRAGGIAMVQLPREAHFSRMPLAALRHTSVDLCAPAAELAEALAKLCAPLATSA